MERNLNSSKGQYIGKEYEPYKLEKDHRQRKTNMSESLLEGNIDKESEH